MTSSLWLEFKADMNMLTCLSETLPYPLLLPMISRTVSLLMTPLCSGSYCSNNLFTACLNCSSVIFVSLPDGLFLMGVLSSGMIRTAWPLSVRLADYTSSLD